ncbi:MAG: glycoside hydrolase family 127 protein [Bacteroidaceae bacterium]|nr:glycoside hydrolase family 127 protein [Bacteroidaceae bacterium]
MQAKIAMFLAAMLLLHLPLQADEVWMVGPSDVQPTSTLYANNRAPLPANPFIKLPPAAVIPRGWIGEMLQRQKNGLSGQLGEISDWLDKKGNAWLEPGGSHGWEEVPYWLRGYANLAYILNDKAMIDETKFWIEGILRSSQPDGFLGPVNENKGRRELWANMLALQILQDYYEWCGDERVIPVLTAYYKWQLAYPEEKFLRDYWENSRGGDNLLSVIWLYNRTGEAFLLDLARKIHRCTANWMQESGLPNWHNVNVAECFREPAEWYLVSGDKAALKATYNNYSLIRRIYGQVPGGMFGSDENCRHGYIDPRQGTETCGFVEQMLSDEILMAQTGNTTWMANLEDVAFNDYPAALTEDMRALRYLTCPNQVQADSNNHHPGVDNGGPFFCMNPFSSRCCQHNHSMGWPYYAENLVLASADGGAAFLIYGDCTAKVKVADGQEILLDEQTHYPFSEDIKIKVSGLKKKTATFPLYFRIPSWTEGAHVTVNGETVDHKVITGLLRITREWAEDDEVRLHFPMRLTKRVWALNKNSISVNYGPLTMSLKIKERYEEKDSRKTAIGDSHWQATADPSKWPTYEIYADSPWNFALDDNLDIMKVQFKPWPENNYPWSHEGTPIEIRAKGAPVEGWGMDATGLCQVLPDYTAYRGKKQDIVLIPMGAARLRISAFPPISRNP